jgi:hypothetical protein
MSAPTLEQLLENDEIKFAVVFPDGTTPEQAHLLQQVFQIGYERGREAAPPADAQQAREARIKTLALLNKRDAPNWGDVQEIGRIALTLEAERDEAVSICLWVAALDKVPTEDRVEWVNAMTVRYLEVADLRRAALVSACPAGNTEDERG